MDFANDGFEGSYGVALKYLADVYVGLMPVSEELNARFEALEARLSKVENAAQQPEQRTIRLVNGRELNTR